MFMSSLKKLVLVRYLCAGCLNVVSEVTALETFILQEKRYTDLADMGEMFALDLCPF